MEARVARISRYPVKGLGPEDREAATLTAGRILSGDRAFALAHGASHWSASEPGWRPKSDFVTLLRTEKLARLGAAWDEEAGILTLLREGKPVARGDPSSVAGRAILEQFFAAYLAGEARGPLRIASAPGQGMTDVPTPFVSLINRASVADLERVVGAPVDPVRFRGNVLIDGLEPWREFDWVGHEIVLGAARLRVAERIGRCVATHVNPDTAARDINVLKTLADAFGHTQMGVYAEVVTGGAVAVGDPIAPA
jgi:uncharacterized protein YcbX